MLNDLHLKLDNISHLFDISGGSTCVIRILSTSDISQLYMLLNTTICIIFIL